MDHAGDKNHFGKPCVCSPLLVCINRYEFIGYFALFGEGIKGGGFTMLPAETGIQPSALRSVLPDCAQP